MLSFLENILAVKLLTTPIGQSDFTTDCEKISAIFLDECFVLYNFELFGLILNGPFKVNYSPLTNLVTIYDYFVLRIMLRGNLIVENGQILAKVLPNKTRRQA